MKMFSFKAMRMASLVLLFFFSQLTALADNPPITPYWRSDTSYGRIASTLPLVLASW